MAIDGAPRLQFVKRTKRIEAEVLERFGRELGRWVDEAHDGNQSAAGRALGITQGHISAMIQGARGPGLPTLIALRQKTGRSIDDLLGLDPLSTTKKTEPPASAAVGDEIVAMVRAALDRELAARGASSAPPPPSQPTLPPAKRPSERARRR